MSQQAASLQVSSLSQAVFKDSQRPSVAQAAFIPLMSSTSFSCLIQGSERSPQSTEYLVWLLSSLLFEQASVPGHFITDVTLQSSNICRELVVKNVSSVLVTNTTWKLRVEYFIHISFIIFTIYLKRKLFRIQTKKDYIFESFLIQSKSWLFDRKHNESRIITFFTFIDRMFLCQYKMFPQVNTIIHQ